MILTNGDSPSSELAKAESLKRDVLIAVDGAANSAKNLGLTPNIICGDYDSVSLEAATEDFPNAEFIPTPDQNYADLEKAILLAMERGATEIVVLGASGGRLDHTLGNLAVMQRYSSAVKLVFLDDFGSCHSLSTPQTFRFHVDLGDTVSLVAFQPNSIVSIKGVKWELKDYPLPVGTQGVSNLAASNIIEVSVANGAVFVLISKSV